MIFLTTYERNLNELGIKYANQITLLAEYKISDLSLYDKKVKINWVKLKMWGRVNKKWGYNFFAFNVRDPGLHTVEMWMNMKEFLLLKRTLPSP